MANTCDPKNVKSAFRALEILEFFSGGESSTTVTEISRRYAYPQSSTSELMNCLVALGYLRRDERGRRFLPTSRLATIGAWVQPRLFRQGGLLAAMDEIASSTGCATVLAGYNMSRLQYLHVVGSAELRADVTAEDGALALLRTAEGRAMLATFSDSYARGLVHRLNSEVDEPYRVRFADLQEERNAFSRSGYVTVRDPAGRSGVAVMIRNAVDGERLVVGVRSPAADFDESTLLQALRSCLGQHVRMAPVPSAEPARAAAVQAYGVAR